jgi:hypothetical protein
MDSTDLEYMTKTLSEVSEDMFDIESYNKYIKSKYQSSEPSSSVILKDGTLVLYIELRSDIKYITTIERNRRTYPDGSVSYHTDNYYIETHRTTYCQVLAGSGLIKDFLSDIQYTLLKKICFLFDTVLYLPKINK